jgi:hypothetical protein
VGETPMMRNSSPSKLALWMEYSFADLDKCPSELFPYYALSRTCQLASLMSNQSSGFIFKVVERGAQIDKSQRIFAFHTQFWA